MSWLKNIFVTGKDLNELLDQGHHVSHVDGAILPDNVIDHDVPPQKIDIPMPTSRTLHIWADVDNSRKRR